jgi:hypothetical protein
MDRIASEKRDNGASTTDESMPPRAITLFRGGSLSTLLSDTTAAAPLSSSDEFFTILRPSSSDALVSDEDSPDCSASGDPDNSECKKE